jgi:3-phosphoshikimate 1-carboxyvinyltransferase
MSVVSLRGEISVPGDKSITHRACIFGAIANGSSVVVTNALGRDNMASIRVLQQLGVEICGELNHAMYKLAKEEGLQHFSLLENSEDKELDSIYGSLCKIEIKGKGFSGLQPALGPFDCGNSGTFARLLTGLLAGQKFESEIIGDHSLSSRPFKRVTDPLSKMGVWFSGDRLPMKIRGGNLTAITYDSAQASAQVKSAILLAGLQVKNSLIQTSISEPHRSRDHTERMLSAMGVKLQEKEDDSGRWNVKILEVPEQLAALEVRVPGDFSAAAFFLVAASIMPNSEITIRNVGINPTRIGLLFLLQKMGANIKIQNERLVAGERVCDFIVRSSILNGITLNEKDVVLAIDEIPILAVAASFANGITEVSGAKELRVKETDRISVTADVIRSFGVEVEEFEDGMRIFGNPELLKNSPSLPSSSIPWRLSGDHRIAMSGAIMENTLTGSFCMLDTKAVETSFPNFSNILKGLTTKN